MKKLLSSTLLLGIVGLAVGYFIFGRVGGNYVGFNQLLNPPESLIKDIAESLTGIKKIRQNILISGAVGAGIGLIFGAVKK